MQNSTTTTIPDQKRQRFSARIEQLLMLCYYDPLGIPTVPETVANIQKNSKFSITVLNLFEHGRNGGVISLSPLLSLHKFDGIVVHNTISYNVDNLRTLDQYLDIPLRSFKGAKILMKQDENFRFKELAQYIGETGFDLIFTCLPDSAISKVYPENLVGTPIFSRMLTGYVTPTLRDIRTERISPRPIDIGYRGSVQPLSFGRLAYEKRKIGDDVQRLLGGRDLRLNISSKWEDRLGTHEWLDFLSSSKATLGAESGASVFDLDGDLQVRCASAEEQLGPLSDDPVYAEAYLSKIAGLEGNVYYNQLSPRHFEAAATRTLQIMYPGRYSDILVADRHFIALSRDYSNLDEVVDLLLDDAKRSTITDCAYEEIVLSPKHWIETFVFNFDDLVSDALRRRGALRHAVQISTRKASNVLLLAAHQPSLDPRLRWVADSSPSDLKITQVGVLPPDSKSPTSLLTDCGNLVLAEPRIRFSPEMLASWYASTNQDKAGWAGLSEINFMAFATNLSEPQFLELFSAPPGVSRVSDFRWYLDYILDTTATLISIVDRIRGFDAIIATDLDTLPAALILKGLTGTPVIYDAHEYWPEADISSFEFERQHWVEMENRLVQNVDHCQTVSPGLAQIMSDQYGKVFSTVPNCEPKRAVSENFELPQKSDQICRFIYQGNFAPGRGLDLLIDAWPKTNEQAHLLLRGPDNAYKSMLIEKARETTLLDVRVFFPSAVAEDELITSARDGDVGLIPYTPISRTYAHCCPNKTSQYMAAGLPILANNTQFVKEMVEAANAGVVVDFSKPENIVAAVAEFVTNPQKILTMGRNGHHYFHQNLHWENVSKPMYDKLIELIGDRPRSCLVVLSAGSDHSLYHENVASAPEPCIDPVLRRPAIFPRILKPIWRLLPTSIRYRLGPAIRKSLKKL